MEPLPTGTVTFLFTDIQGSTTLWEHSPEAAHAALVRHDQLVEEVVTRSGGTLVRPRGEGDSRFAVFTRASDAVAAAAALQQALYTEPWPTPTPLQVRMAIHTGEADLRAGDYYGTAVNRCARLRAVAHGGQTVLSHATFDLVRDAVAQDLLPGVSLRDLGEHRLKDLIRPEHIHQLVVRGVPDAFPALLSLDMHRHNLPVQRSPLLGREQEVTAVTSLLRRPDVGLVTLTGPGGTGKTRLALQVAAELLGSFPQGVYFVDLAALSDPGLVITTIAQALNITETGSQDLLDSVAAYLRDQQVLLVLDNFEQVVDAAPLVTTLLQGAIWLKILVTSRFVLHLIDEYEYRVPPLAVPDLKLLPPLERLTQYAAVQLFIQRARAVKVDFRVTNTSAPAVAEICVRLDGLPLAIELAAARIKLFPPQALLLRLDSRLKTLTGSARDVAARQQTLRAAIDWSYELLEPAEQTLFARLAVFVGGCTLEAAEAICPADRDPPGAVLDGLQSLLDKSLLQQTDQTDGTSRIRMLETIHEFALERLAASGEAWQLRQQHAAYYLALVESGERAVAERDTPAWLARLDADHDNLRAVLRWATTHDVPTAVAIAASLKDFWYIRGYWREGQRWVEALLPLSTEVDGVLRSRMWDCAGVLAELLGNPAKAQACFEQALLHARAADYLPGVSWALRNIGVHMAQQGDQTRAFALFEESLALSQQLGHQGGIGIMLQTLGDAWVALDPGRAEAYYRESLPILRAIGYEQLIAFSLGHLAELALRRRDAREARTYSEECLALARTIDSPELIIDALMLLGSVARLEGNHHRAADYYRESLQRAHAWGDARWTMRALDSVVVLEAVRPAGDLIPAARLAGAVAALRERMAIPVAVNEQGEHDEALAALRARVDEVAFEAAWAEGTPLALDGAVAAALAILANHTPEAMDGSQAAV